MYRVALRYKSKRGDTMKSVYLEFRPSITDIRGHVIRYEFLNLELYTKPKNAIQKQHNKVIEEVAEEIEEKKEHKNSFYAIKTAVIAAVIMIVVFLSILLP